jgi:predicted extracellular nuclease
MRPQCHFCLIVWFVLTGISWGQLSYTGGVVFQDFNSLPSSGSFTFTTKGPQALDQAPIHAASANGWSLFANVGTPLAFAVDTGGSTSASVYSYGTAGSGERALGFIANSTRTCRAGLRLFNNTSQTLTQVHVSYVGEEWRSGGTANANTVIVDYRISATAFDIDAGGTYTALTALNYSSPTSYAQSVGLNGNLSANRNLITATFNVSWPVGQMLMIRWRDDDSTGEDDGLAIDDVAFYATPQTAAPPQVLSTLPVASASAVATASRLAVLFNQPVTATGAWAQLVDASLNVVPVTFSGGQMRFEVTPTSRLLPGQNYTLTVFASQITSASGTVMGANVVVPFTTQAATVNPQLISAVQGVGTATPFANQLVAVTGVVTADFQGPPPALGGFFMQSLAADVDAEAATSEGIFVYDFSSEGSGAVAVGDVVTLTATAAEFGSQTQLSNVSALSLNGSVSLPALTDATLPMITTTSLEPLEGMRIRFPQTLHVTSASTSANFSFNYARNGELILAADGPLVEPTEYIDPNDNPASGTSTSGSSNVPAITALASAPTLRTLVLDDASTAVYPFPTPHLNALGTRRCGDTVMGLSGILSFSSGRYRVQPTSAVTFADTNPRPTAPPALTGRLKVVAMNVLNYFTTFDGTNDRGADNATEFQRQKDKIISALAGLDADILGLMEIQNSSAAVTDLLTALNAAVADDYTLVAAPANGVGGDAIRCVWLYRTSKVSLYGPCYSDADSVWNTPNPLRQPLAQVFIENSTGERCLGCLNHWKSKSSSGATGLNLDQNDGQGAWNDLRKQQANRLHTWLQTIVTLTGENDILIIGDLNSLGEEDPLDVLRGLGYADQSARFDANDYSYRNTELRGRLDHAFAANTLVSQILSGGHWHINADEPAFYDYNTENKTAAHLLVNVGTPFRSSDHDPILLGLSLSPQPTTYAMWQAARAWASVSTGALEDPDGDGLQNWVEFALNTNPEMSSAAQLPVANRMPDELRFDFRQRVQLSGTQVIPEWSEDMISWSPMPTTTTLESLDLQTELKRTVIPTVGKDRLFLRLRVTGP